MNGTLSIQGELTLLGKLATKIDEWIPGAFATETIAEGWGGWTADTMAVLLERVHPWQLLLVSYLAQGDGRRTDPEVRAKFAGESGLRGQTGAISKHIERMKAENRIANDASFLVKVDRSARVAAFVIPQDLVPIVQAALARPALEHALIEARISQELDERH